MAAPQRILSLNIGMQTVSLAEFRANPQGGLILRQFKLTELLADPATDATRFSQAKIAISEMLAAFGIKQARTNYAIAAQSVFTRFVKLPTVSADRVDQIIQFEAQQNVPFPINEVVWDYQLVGDPAASQIEVVLVAIKSDLLDDVNGSVEDAGLQTGIVDVAPMALYNAFRYNYGEMDDCSLIIDIGARTTNLIFVEPQKVFSRSIPIGGTSITAAIAKDFNEPFGAAEERKKAYGSVGLGAAYEEPEDPEMARLTKVIRTGMTRLHSEISRSISFYRSQQQGSQPKRVYLSGGSAVMPYMREFFQDKLHLPIEFFNALRNISVAPEADVEAAGRSAHVLGELVGLGLRAVTSCPMELNLQPAKVERAAALAQKRPYLIVAGLCLLLCLAGWWLYFQRATDIQAAVLEKLAPQVGALQGVANQFTAVKGEEKKATALAEPLTNAVLDRQFLVKLVEDVNTRLPERFIWVTVFEPGSIAPDGKFEPVASIKDPATKANSDEQPSPLSAGNAPKAVPALRLHGLYLDNPKQTAVVDDFLNNLAQSPFFDVDLEKRSEINPVRNPANGTDWAYDYEFILPLKKELPQP